MIAISVTYASLDTQIEIPLMVQENCTVAVAIRRSGILKKLPRIHFADIKVGVFGKRVALDALVQANDRIEIYRPLLIDPKEARILRAARKKKDSHPNLLS